MASDERPHVWLTVLTQSVRVVVCEVLLCVKCCCLFLNPGGTLFYSFDVFICSIWLLGTDSRIEPALPRSDYLSESDFSCFSL